MSTGRRYFRTLQAKRQREAEQRIAERVYWATHSEWSQGGPCVCGGNHREMLLRIGQNTRVMCPIVYWTSWAWKEVIEKGDKTWTEKHPLTRLLGKLRCDANAPDRLSMETIAFPALERVPVSLLHT